MLVGSYLQQEPPREYPIVSACTLVVSPEGQKWLIQIHEAIWVENAQTKESLLHPFQAMRHGVVFDMTPLGYKAINNMGGQQVMVVGDQKIPMRFDQKKLYLELRRPSDHDLRIKEYIELTSCQPWTPEEDMRRDARPARTYKKEDYLVVTLEEWRKCLGFVPDEVIEQTLEATTQFCLIPEEDYREVPRKHYKSRFPFLREKRLNGEVHSDTFFPSVTSAQGHKCSQIFYGKNTGLT